MKQFLIRLTAVFLLLCLLAPMVGVSPARAEETQEAAENIADWDHFTDYSGFNSLSHLYDGIDSWGAASSANCSVTLENDGGIGSLYIIFHTVQDLYTVTDNGSGTVYTREEPLLHDFLDLEAAFGSIPTSITITFGPDDLVINELYAFTPGQVPEFVQQWQLPGEGDTDLVLFSTHGDDEHLFFAGILPYYAGELGYQVQVVYLTDHHNNVGPTRMREMLDGLWAVGIKTYPIFGNHPDFLQRDIATTYMQFKRNNITREDLIGFVVEQLRRFKPKVAVGHDFNGEYGHGQHMVYADVLAAAVEISMDPTQYPETAEAYGVWDVPKTYIHLYEENEIVMDWDQPLENFDGMTAFEVSIQLGFQKHKSQVPDFEWYYRNCDTAAEVPEHNPCYFGLLRSTVGEDVEKNDFFENVTTHAQDAQLEAQRLQEEEEARLKAEEEARLKAEEEARLASEAAAQATETTAAPETTAPIQQEAAPAGDSQELLSVLAAACVVLLILAGILIIFLIRRKRIKKYF